VKSGKWKAENKSRLIRVRKSANKFPKATQTVLDLHRKKDCFSNNSPMASKF
jgi:hypothetical protein